jgi:hypothetical protein
VTHRWQNVVVRCADLSRGGANPETDHGMVKKRTDAERRARQCERISRVIRQSILLRSSGIRSARRGKDPWRGPAGTPWDWDSSACFLTPVFYFALDHAGMRSWRGAYETAKLDHCGGRRREMSAELGPSHRRCDWCAATWTRENAIDAAEDVLKIGLTAT